MPVPDDTARHQFCSVLPRARALGTVCSELWLVPVIFCRRGGGGGGGMRKDYVIVVIMYFAYVRACMFWPPLGRRIYIVVQDGFTLGLTKGNLGSYSKRLS